MLRNYVKTAARSLRRHPGYAAINVVGLAVGIAVCLLITLYVRHELSYDDFHERADRIVRVVSDWGNFSAPLTSWPVVRHLESDYPEVPIVRLRALDPMFGRGDQSFTEARTFATGPSFFDVFSFPLRRGDPATALKRPYTAVLTPEMARRAFGDVDPMGKTLTVDNEYEVEVTGIVEPAPAASHVHYDVLVSWATLDAAFNYREAFANSWGANHIYTYLLLPTGASAEEFEARLPDFVERHAGDDWNKATLLLQPLTSIHLHSHHNSEIEPNGSAAALTVFGLIAVLVLVLACVNFMNLATARAVERATEVGVRKSVGAARGQVAQQFLTESMMMAGMALVLALGLAAAGLPAIEALAGVPLRTSLLADPFAIGTLVAITVLAGGLAGSYPAVFLSRFPPIRALRASTGRVGEGARLRRGLVIFQFVISTGLIIAASVAYMQLDHLRSAPVGFDREQVVTVPVQDDALLTRYETFRSQLLQDPSITEVSVASTELPSELLDGNGFGFADAGLPRDSLRGLRMVGVGHGFFETLGTSLLAGRSFDRDRPSDSTTYVINEAAFRLLAADLPSVVREPQDAVGRRLQAWGDWPFEPTSVIGVVDNFNLATLHEAVEPMIFFIYPDMFSTYYVRLEPGAAREGLPAIEAAWARVFPEWPFEYQFVDRAFDTAYRTEQRLGQLVAVFAGLAILIACLGLLGLAAFTAQQRTKEIGIRKALGATVAGVVAMLATDFVRPVSVAVVLAAPVAYLLIDRWLQTFAYRVEVGPGVFVLAGVGALLVALLTVSVQAVRAARTDPARALRSE